MPTRPDIFGYAQYRRYIDDWFTSRKAERPRLSHRWVSKRLGSTDPGLLANLVSGRRSLAGARITDWIALLELEGDAAEYFRALVSFEDAIDQPTATRAWAQLAEIRARRADPAIGPDSFELLGAWYVPAVRELVACVDFDDDPAWIAARLDPPITVDEAERAIAIALRLGFLRRGDEGRLVRAEPSARTPNEVTGLATWPFHRDGNALVERSLQLLRSGERPGYERETLFLGNVTALPGSQLADLRAELFQLFFKVSAEADARAERGDPCDRVVLLSLSLVPVTR